MPCMFLLKTQFSWKEGAPDLRPHLRWRAPNQHLLSLQQLQEIFRYPASPWKLGESLLPNFLGIPLKNAGTLNVQLSIFSPVLWNWLICVIKQIAASLPFLAPGPVDPEPKPFTAQPLLGSSQRKPTSYHFGAAHSDGGCYAIILRR